jgi:hypothetical protein
VRHDDYPYPAEPQPGILIDYIGGNCPVQAEGSIDGQRFYFRARGQHWSLSIGGDDPAMSEGWYYDQPFGDTKYAAGWMTWGQAEAYIIEGARRYRRQMLMGKLLSPIKYVRRVLRFPL